MKPIHGRGMFKKVDFLHVIKMLKTKKYVAVNNVLDTEDIKPKQKKDIRAKDGICKHLRNIIIRQKSTLMQVWKIIGAEIQV